MVFCIENVKKKSKFNNSNQPTQGRVKVKAVGKVRELQNLSPTFYLRGSCSTF